MREVKFRAWHTGLGRMTEPNFIDCDGNCFDFLSNSWDSGMEKDERYILMQFTGLKDKNGKEIYEGDILKRPSINQDVHGSYSYQEVIYRNGTWIVQYIKSEKGNILPKGWTAGTLIDCYEYDQENLVFDDGRLEDTDIEVIGNIYENPELLEGNTP